MTANTLPPPFPSLPFPIPTPYPTPPVPSFFSAPFLFLPFPPPAWSLPLLFFSPHSSLSLPLPFSFSPFPSSYFPCRFSSGTSGLFAAAAVFLLAQGTSGTELHRGELRLGHSAPERDALLLLRRLSSD